MLIESPQAYTACPISRFCMNSNASDSAAANTKAPIKLSAYFYFRGGMPTMLKLELFLIADVAGDTPHKGRPLWPEAVFFEASLLAELLRSRIEQHTLHTRCTVSHLFVQNLRRH